MKKKLTIILLSMVVAVTMLAPLQAFAQDTAAVAGQQSEQADSQEETSAPAQTQETAQKYTVKFRAADARGHLLKGAAFRVSAQNGGGCRPPRLH
jgi:Ni/Co efflux regulator RcnB